MKQTLLLLTTYLSIGITSCKKDVMLPPADNGGEFQIAFGGEEYDRANSILYSGGYLYILGITYSFGHDDGDIYLVKMDLNGKTIWKKTYGGSTEEAGFRIIETSNGDLLIAGLVQANAPYRDIYVIRLTPDGDMIWENTYGGDGDELVSDVIELSDGNFMIAGSTQSPGAALVDIYLVKINGDGTQLFGRMIGGSNLEIGRKLSRTTTNKIMLLAGTQSYGAGDRDFYLLQLNSNGDTIFTKTYGGAGYEETQSMKRLANGNYLLHGHSASNQPAHNMYSLVVNESGDVIWEKEFGGLEHDGGQAALQDSRTNLVLVGETNSFGSGRQIYFVKTDTYGNLIEEKTFGGSGDEQCYDVVEAGQSYFIVGMTNSIGAGDYDMFVIKKRR